MRLNIFSKKIVIVKFSILVICAGPLTSCIDNSKNEQVVEFEASSPDAYDYRIYLEFISNGVTEWTSYNFIDSGTLNIKEKVSQSYDYSGCHLPSFSEKLTIKRVPLEGPTRSQEGNEPITSNYPSIAEAIIGPGCRQKITVSFYLENGEVQANIETIHLSDIGQ